MEMTVLKGITLGGKRIQRKGKMAFENWVIKEKRSRKGAISVL